MPACIEWGVERHQECDQTRDNGYRNCCTWAPCSWFCDAWTWVSHVVCVSWTWVSTAICVVWDVVTTVVGGLLVFVESMLGWVLSAIAAIIELIMAIPVLGTLIRWVWNAITHVVWIIISIPDIVAGLIGIRPEKLLRVCTVIALDERGNVVAPMTDATIMLQMACDVYKRDANVRILPSRMMKFSTGFAGPETADGSWSVIESLNSDTRTLDPSCGPDGVGSEWLTGGSLFQLKLTRYCFYGAWRRIIGYGAPVGCFFVRNVAPDSATSSSVGCAFWITDFAVMENLTTATLRTLAHEVGHASNLWHQCVDDDTRNLMAAGSACSPSSLTPPNTTNPRMNNLQILAVRASKHCTYF